ncbi:type II toxin-antitoxin system VapC family toxin [Phenylobacterium sp.]|uniref:type II toxin-antitoxin system VapC family toxin n=1 Tax=Phenylobacterium sp. TaxID=1871053 RepID=UPI0025D0116B|nr:type II toxin-antitoxin system VapC family toxin [Phenylobacterium sp.]
MLDTSAILTWFWNEPGGDRLHDVLDEAHISAVNLAEVAQKLGDKPVDDATIGRMIGRLAAVIEPFDGDDALQAGLWRRATRSRGLSLGDRACLALGKRLGLPVYTADRAWAELDLGVEVVLIR